MDIIWVGIHVHQSLLRCFPIEIHGHFGTNPISPIPPTGKPASGVIANVVEVSHWTSNHTVTRGPTTARLETQAFREAAVELPMFLQEAERLRERGGGRESSFHESKEFQETCGLATRASCIHSKDPREPYPQETEEFPNVWSDLTRRLWAPSFRQEGWEPQDPLKETTRMVQSGVPGVPASPSPLTTSG